MVLMGRELITAECANAGLDPASAKGNYDKTEQVEPGVEPGLAILDGGAGENALANCVQNGQTEDGPVQNREEMGV